jgi:16S rRNA (guanine1207-N2)-methyltransferase
MPLENRAFMLRAEWTARLEADWKKLLVCEQSSRSLFLPLEKAGFQTVGKIEGDFDLALCLLTKHKKENYGNIARAWDHLSPGGILVCAGDNDSGVKSFEKNVKKVMLVSGNISKNHGRVFWLEKSAPGGTYPEEWNGYRNLAKHITGTDFVTQPGMFCWEKVDKGSAFLAENLPRKISGTVADFGAGWGYLSHEILPKCPGITALDLYEDEALALEAARRNLEPLPHSGKASFLWADLSGACPKPNHYNWIIMNPPFHRSARTDVSLGIKFIENAARSLKRSGSLLLVANRQLPYERPIGEYFKSSERIAESADFKIILASSPSLQ